MDGGTVIQTGKGEDVMIKIKVDDIVLFGYAKGGGLKENIVIWVGRKYAIIRDKKLHPKYTYQDVKIEISELIKRGVK